MATPSKAPEFALSASPNQKVGVPSLAARIEELLREIFEGHEEYLGLTPD